MITVNDIWGSIRVPLNEHRNEVGKLLRDNKVPAEVRDEVRMMIHKFNVAMSEKIAADLNRGE